MSLLPRFLRTNLRIKAGMFLLALLLWFLVVSGKTYEQIIETPLVVTGLKTGRVLASPLPPTARVRYHGTGRELLQMIYLTKPHLQVDLATINQHYLYRLRPDMVMIPGGGMASAVEIVAPETLQVFLDEQLILTVPVQARVEAELAPGYTISRIESRPSRVTVTGPRRAVEGLRQLRTVTAHLGSLRRNDEVRLEVQKPEVFGVTVAPQQVTVAVKVEKIAERVLTGLPVRVAGRFAGQQAIVEPAMVDLKVTGAAGALNELTAADLDVFVDLADFEPARSGLIKVKAATESPLEVVQITPPSVRLILRR